MFVFRETNIKFWSTGKADYQQIIPILASVPAAETRSKLIRNPKVAGWRKPSAYSRRKGLTSDHVAFTLSFFGSESESFDDRHEAKERDITIYGDVERPLKAKWSMPSYHQLEGQRMKALLKLTDEKVDAAMMIAEVHKSMATFGNLALSLLTSLDKLRKRDPSVFKDFFLGTTRERLKDLKGKRANRMLRRQANMYLAFKYGVMPTVYDMQGLAKLHDEGYTKALVRGRSSVTTKSKVPIKTSIRTSDSKNFEIKGDATIETRISTAFYGEVDASTDWYRKLRTVGFSPTTVATVVWDIAPWSLLTDHLIDVASIIKSASATAGLKNVSGTQTIVVKCTEGEVTGVVQGTPFKLKGSVSGTPFIMSRVLVEAGMALPHLKDPFTLSNATSWLAFATSFYKRSGERT